MILNFIDNIIKLTECVHLNGRPSVSTFNVILDLNGLTELRFCTYVEATTIQSEYFVSVVDIRQILGYPDAKNIQIHSSADTSVFNLALSNKMCYVSHASSDIIVNECKSDVTVITGLDDVMNDLSQLSSYELIDDLQTSLKCFLSDIASSKASTLLSPSLERQPSACLPIILLSNKVNVIPNSVQFLFEITLKARMENSDIDFEVNKGHVTSDASVSAANENLKCNYLLPSNDQIKYILLQNGYSWFESIGLLELNKERFKDRPNHSTKHVGDLIDNMKICISKDCFHGGTNSKISPVHWSGIGGLESVRQEITEVIHLPQEQPQYFPPSLPRHRGLLLFGPPGTGKTLVAKAVATELNMNFISVKGPELLDMYVGESERNIRQLFETAKGASPCVLFFDEVDSIAPKRGQSGDSSGGVVDRCVSQLITEIDNVNSSRCSSSDNTDCAINVFVIAATNRPDLLDPSLLAPGRLDRRVYLAPCNTTQAQYDIFRAQLRRFNVKIDDNEGVSDSLVSQRQCTNGIDLREICELLNTKIKGGRVTGADIGDITSRAYLHAQKRLICKINLTFKESFGRDSFNSDFAFNAGLSRFVNSLPQSALLVYIQQADLIQSISNVKPSVSADELRQYDSMSSTFCQHN